MSLPAVSAPVTPMGEVLRARYVDRNHHIAMHDGHRSLTYSALGTRATRLANGLRAAGLDRGDRIMLIAANSCEWVEVDHACYRGGFVRVAVLPRLHPRELAQIARDADPAAVIADAQWLATAGTDWVPDSVRLRVGIGGTVEGTVPFEDLVAGGDENEPPPADPDAVQWISYTSGTTGTPKGVVYTSRTIGAMVRNICTEMRTPHPDSAAVHTAPLSHFSGAVAAAVFAAGGTNVLLGSFDIPALIDALATGDVDVLPLVPTQITMLTEALAAEEAAGRHHDTSSVRLLLYAGSAIAPNRLAEAQRRFGRVMLQMYGSTEAPMPLTALHPEDHIEEASAGGRLPRLASAGQPTRYVELKIRSDSGRDLASGEVGEVVARGQQVTPGYWNSPEETAKVLDNDGWFRTGDAGYLDADGYLFLVDRKKDMIVTGGFNVYPREVENVISTLDGVREVAVVGAPSARWGEEITAVVAPTEGTVLTAEDVIAHCRNSLGGYKIPKRVEFVTELPKSGAGKILKREIREKLWAGRARRV
jgi:long-chain acyl-CoA synthetase